MIGDERHRAMPTSEATDVAVIGGGAAGLAAAIFAAEARAATGALIRIHIFDRAPRLGAKLLISGGGRCNVTNATVTPRDFHGSQPVIRNILAAFDAAAARRWFQSLGVRLKEEPGGKLFPTTDRARTVLDALLRRCGELKVDIVTNCRVTGIGYEPDAMAPAFQLDHANGRTTARCVIMATGGGSLPRSGSDGTGWEIVRRLGHTVTDVRPALVPLILDDAMFHAELAGVSHQAELTTVVDGTVRDRRTGGMLWTHFGISGPVVMDASRFWTTAAAEGRSVRLRCHVLPGEDFQRVRDWMLKSACARPTLTVARFLAQRLPDRLADALCRVCGVSPAMPIGQLPAGARHRLIHAMIELPLPVVGPRGWNYAEVTAGGVPLREIDFRTMASRKVPGLFLVGEMLDCDGRIGGFNFQWAWATGYVGGRGAVASLLSRSVDARRP